MLPEAATLWGRLDGASVERIADPEWSTETRRMIADLFYAKGADATWWFSGFHGWQPLDDAPDWLGSIDGAMALACTALDTTAIDIEVAYRTLAAMPEPFGRAEICGPSVYAHAQGVTPPVALLMAVIQARFEPPAVTP